MIGAAKLLTVDTNPASRRAVAELLRSAGWNVEANDDDPAVFRKKLQGLGQGLDLASFGVAVIDLDAMPGVDEILKELRLKDPHLPILQITARAKDAGGTEMAADALLIRPFEGAELLSLVRMLIRLREARQAADESETWLQLAQEAGGLAVMEMRLLTGQARWSPKFAEIFQLPPDAVAPGLIARRVHPEDLPRLRKEYEINLQRGEPFEGDFRICLPDGSTRWIAMRGKFGKDASGRAERILFLTSDITPRKEAELQNAQLAAIVSSSIDAIVSVDFADRIRTWNRGAERLFGYQAAEVLGGPASFLVPPDLLEERSSLMQRLASGETIEYHTLRRRKDGQMLNVWIRGAPVRSVNGALAGGSLIIRDVTAQHRHEEHVRFLMRELTHRSKNLLAVIQAMARQTLSHQTSPEDFVARFSERLSGLAGSHDLLSSDDWAGASLVQLIRSQLQHYGDLFEERIFLEGPDLFLRPEAAQNIGIALHELSTNAAKFGSLSVPEGKVTISWSFALNEQGERRLHLIWAERGGPSVITPDHKGFGHMVMHRITGPALGGQSYMQFEPGGVTWHLDVPVADVIRHKDENDRPRDTEAP
jgi:PAS domain S-box-containing protein